MKNFFLAGLLCVCLMCGCAQKAATPQKAFKIAQKAILRGDWETYWNMLSVESKERFMKQVVYMQDTYSKLSDPLKSNLLESLDVTESELFKLDGKTFFINALKLRDRDKKPAESRAVDLFKSCVIIDCTIKDQSAKLYVEDEEGYQVEIPLIKENGEWKLDFAKYYPF